MLIVDGAELVWTGRRELPSGAVVACAGGRVTAVGNDAALGPSAADIPAGDAGPGQAERLDASGCVVVPGLVNAHHHLLESAFRTLPGTRHRPMKEWLAAMGAAYARVGVDAELTSAAAAVGLAESLLAGVTTVTDHHLSWPPGAGNGVPLAEATAAAARRLGARLVFVRGTAGDDPDTAALSAEAIARALGGTGGLVQVAVGPAGVHVDPPATFFALGEVAARYGLVRRTQAGEQIDDAIAAERYGATPLELLDEWGWLAPDVTVAHLCRITPDDANRLVRSGAAATHAPGCDLVQGWGLAHAGALLDLGVRVGLGTGGGGSTDAGHLLADARLAMQTSPLVGRALTAREVLAMATRGSAAGLGRDELGHLEPGAAADLCCYDVTGVADAGVADRLAGLVWANPGRRPRHVVVGGRVVVRDGHLVNADERSLGADLARLLVAGGTPSPPPGAAPRGNAPR